MGPGRDPVMGVRGMGGGGGAKLIERALAGSAATRRPPLWYLSVTCGGASLSS
jgi:hypothetical protein